MSMAYTVREYRDYRENEIMALYKSVAWSNYTQNPQMLRQAFDNSLLVLGAYDKDKLLGIIRVVGDGASIIYVQDILVYPKYQGRGIGKMLLERILEYYKNVYQITLMADYSEKNLSFYSSLGFNAARDIGISGMIKM